MENQEIIQHLKDLAWSKQETQIYLTLLHLGSQSAKVVANNLKRNRITVYHALERLVEKGTVESSLGKGTKYYTAINPEILILKYKEERQKALNRLDLGIESLEWVLPYLQKLEVKDDIGPQIQLLNGKDALKNIYRLSLETTKMFAYYQPWPVAQQKRLLSIDDWHTIERVKRKIPAKILVPKTSEGIQFAAVKTELKETLVVPNSLFPFKDVTIITDDKMLIFSLADEIGVSIKSKHIAKNQQAIFELAWEGAKAILKKS